MAVCLGQRWKGWPHLGVVSPRRRAGCPLGGPLAQHESALPASCEGPALSPCPLPHSPGAALRTAFRRGSSGGLGWGRLRLPSTPVGERLSWLVGPGGLYLSLPNQRTPK